jgi:hypothetical protein
MNRIYNTVEKQNKNKTGSDSSLFFHTLPFHFVFDYNLLQRQTSIEKIALTNPSLLKDIFLYFPPYPTLLPSLKRSFTSSEFLLSIENQINSCNTVDDFYKITVNKESHNFSNQINEDQNNIIENIKNEFKAKRKELISEKYCSTAFHIISEI